MALALLRIAVCFDLLAIVSPARRRHIFRAQAVEPRDFERMARIFNTNSHEEGGLSM